MRNYELQIYIIGVEHPKATDNRRISGDLCYAIKEWLRMICDALSTNECIDHLTVKMLGLCALRDLELTLKIIDSLAPLTRLRVNKTTVFFAHYHACH